MWIPQYEKLGPPKTKPQRHHPQLDVLETLANRQCVSDYEQEIANYLSLIENNTAVSCAMIDLQPEIQWFMRPYLLDFLVEIHQSFRLHPQTLFLAVAIIDRYCSKRVVFKRHYQLVGCTGLWLAAKYEDKKSRVPTLKELTVMCRNAYDAEMFVQMERHILSTLEWNLSHVSLEDCLQLSLNKQQEKEEVENMARFFCELSLYERNFLQVPASIIAITSHLLASNILGSNIAVKSFYKTLEKCLEQHYHDEIDDDETFDEDFENNYPNVVQPFLSGYNDDLTPDQINKVGIMLISSFQNCSQALQNKYQNYQDVNYIKLITNFITKNQDIIQILPSIDSFNNGIDEVTLPHSIIKCSLYLIGLTSDPRQDETPKKSNSNIIQPQQFQSFMNPPLTPPSASSTMSSVFSSSDYHNNYSTTSLAITPSTSPMDINLNKNLNSDSNPSYTLSQQSRSIFKKPTLPTKPITSNPTISYSNNNSSHSNTINNHNNNNKRRLEEDLTTDEEEEEEEGNEPEDDKMIGSSPLVQRERERGYNKLNMMI